MGQPVIFSTRFRLIVSFLAMAALVGGFSLVVGVQLLTRSVFNEATNRIRLDLNAAREIYRSVEDRLNLGLSIRTLETSFISALQAGDIPFLRGCLQSVAARLDLDPAPFAAVADRVGGALAAGGYRGVFGLDFVLGEDGELYVIEVNPRLVASIALYAQLELAAGRLPLLARHVLAFLAPDLDDAPLDAHWAPVDCAQVILHNLGGHTARVEGNLRSGLLADVSGHGGPAVRMEAAHVSAAGTGDVLLLAPGRGRVVGAGQELARLQGRGAMTTSYGSVDGAILAAAAAVVDGANLGPVRGESGGGEGSEGSD